MVGSSTGEGVGRKTSALDDLRTRQWTAQQTRELLELLWVLEATVAGYHEQEQLLESVLRSSLLPADDLPDVPEPLRLAHASAPLFDVR